MEIGLVVIERQVNSIVNKILLWTLAFTFLIVLIGLFLFLILNCPFFGENKQVTSENPVFFTSEKPKIISIEKSGTTVRQI